MFIRKYKETSTQFLYVRACVYLCTLSDRFCASDIWRLKQQFECVSATNALVTVSVATERVPSDPVYTVINHSHIVANGNDLFIYQRINYHLLLLYIYSDTQRTSHCTLDITALPITVINLQRFLCAVI